MTRTRLVAAAVGRRTLRIALCTLVAAAVLATAAPAFAQLNRVGPVGPLGYPTWYQDKSGLTLEFCDNRTQAELAGGWCVLLPPDVPAGTAPESRTGSTPNFAEEHFYFLLNSGTRKISVPGFSTPITVLLVSALEGAFATGPVKVGDEMVFARLRIKINPVPYSGTYTVWTPFGKRVFPDQVAGQKRGIFVTEDIGLTPGSFTEALNGSIYPFLLPSPTPGGPEMPPVSMANPTPDTDPAHFGGGAPTAYPGNGRSYIADPARLGPITGSVADYSGDANLGITTPNIFRVDVDGPEVPGGHLTLLSTTDFNLAGRIYEAAMAGDVNVKRANYSRGGTSSDKLDIFATATSAIKPRIPAQAAAAPIPSTLLYYNDSCVSTPDALGNPGPPYSAPPNAMTVPMMNSGSNFLGQYGTLPGGLVGCLEMNSTTADGQTLKSYAPIPLTDQVSISQAKYDATQQTLVVKASSSDATLQADGVTPLHTLTVVGFGNLTNGQLTVNQLLAPPANVTVISSGGGFATRQVSTGAVAAGSGGGPAPEPVPVATNQTATTVEDTGASFILTGNTMLNVVVMSPGSLGSAVANGTSVTYTPNPNAFGTDTFTYALRTMSGLMSNTATVTVTITPVNDAPTAVADIVDALAGVTSSISVLANDTDPDGASDLATVVVETADAALGNVTVVNGAVQITPTLPLGSGPTPFQFSYHAVDKAGAISNTVTDTVRVYPSESIVPAKWQYTQSKARWTVTGTVTPNEGQTMTITYASGTFNVWNPATNKFACTGNAVGQLVGTGPTDATGTWLFDTILTNTNSILNPSNTNNQVASPDGKVRTSLWCSSPTLRITSPINGNAVTTTAVQLK